MMPGLLSYEGHLLSPLGVRWCSHGYYIGREVLREKYITRQSNYYPTREAAKKALAEYPTTRLADHLNFRLYEAEDRESRAC